MTDNFFNGCSMMLGEPDFMALEKAIGSTLPSAFKRHYAKWNGGMPKLDWFPMKENWEPIWIHEFLPIENVAPPN